MTNDARLSRRPLGRVCLVMMSAVGDTVHALPVVTALKRHDPASRLTWILQPGPATLVRGHADVDEILVFERARGLAGLRAFAEIARELRPRRFDLVIALQVYFKAGVITAMTNAPVKLGFDRARARDLNWLFTTHRIPARPGRHVQDQYFEFLEYLGIPAEPVTWNLGPWPAERPWQREFFASFDRPVAAIVAATSKPEKDWMPERWATLCDVLWAEYGLQPVIVGARSAREVEAARVVERLARHPVRDALGSGLRNLVGILEGSALVIAPDTGPLHIANALGRPVIGLYGYSNPKRHGPYRRNQDLIVDAYGDPGEDYPLNQEWRPGRMTRIGVADVIETLEIWKARYAPSAVASSFPNR